MNFFLSKFQDKHVTDFFETNIDKFITNVREKLHRNASCVVPNKYLNITFYVQRLEPAKVCSNLKYLFMHYSQINGTVV